MASEIHKGHRERMLNRFMQGGAAGLSEHELLEVVLFFSVPRRNTNDIAHNLITEFGSLAGVFDANEKDLTKHPYITKRTVQLFKMIKEASKEYNIQKSDKRSAMTTLDEVGTYLMTRYAGENEEKVTILCFNSVGKLLSFVTVSEGDVSSVGISARKIIAEVLKCGATSVVLAHNHPSGIPTPSKADKEATVFVKHALESINVRLQDHIIISSGDYFSMLSSAEYKEIFD